MRGYQVLEGKKSSYAARKAGNMAMMITGGVLILFMLLMLVANDGNRFLKVVKWHWLLLIVGGVFGLRYIQEMNLANALIFFVEKDRIIKTYHTQMLNEGNKYGMRKEERRYGSKAHQEIKIADIERVQISDKRIKILSKDYNFFNGNGMIEIPAEVNEYEQLKRHFERFIENLNEK